jgi:hypothetical protein
MYLVCLLDYEIDKRKGTVGPVVVLGGRRRKGKFGLIVFLSGMVEFRQRVILEHVCTFWGGFCLEKNTDKKTQKFLLTPHFFALDLLAIIDAQGLHLLVRLYMHCPSGWWRQFSQWWGWAHLEHVCVFWGV